MINESLQITKNDNVQLYCNRHTLDLAEALTLECQKAGAHANISLYTDKIQYDVMLDRPIEYLEAPDPFNLATLDVATISIDLSMAEDPAKYEKVTAERWNAMTKANVAYNEKILKTNHQGTNISLGLVTPQRAKTYGLDYDAWRKNSYAAIDVDYGEMQQVAKKLKTALAKAKEIHITNAAGADLKAQIGGGQIKVDDGVLDRKGSDKASRDVELPGGSVTIVPNLSSVKGTFVSDTALAFVAKLVEGINWKFDNGNVVSFEGKKNISLMKDRWLESTGDKGKFGYIRFGLNPNARPGFLFDRIIRGAITVVIGDNRWVGGTNKSDMAWGATSVAATVKLDGKIIIDKGKMAL